MSIECTITDYIESVVIEEEISKILGLIFCSMTSIWVLEEKSFKKALW